MELAAGVMIAAMVLFTLGGFAYGFGKGRARVAAADEDARRNREK